MTKDRSTVLGRDAERDLLDDVVLHTPGSLIVLRGAPGVGKTALLDAASAGWRRGGVRVVDVAADDPELPFPDAVLAAVREQWDQYCDPSLFGLVHSAVRSYRDGSAGPVTMTVVYELTRVLGQLAKSKRTVLRLDDVDLAGAHDAGELSLFCRGAVACGAVVVVALRDQPGMEPLLSVADTVLELPPLPEEEIETLLARRSGGRLPLDAAVVDALRAGLGSWFGNPGAVLGCVTALAESGRLLPADGHLCLTGPAEVALPAGHVLLAGAGPLASAVAELGGLRVDDLPLLAAATGEPADGCGRTLDRLVRRGTLRLAPDGTAHPAVPALGAALRTRLPAVERERLHAAFADAQLGRARRNVGVDLGALARHVVRAGAPTPRPAATDLLLAEAERVAVLDPNTATDCRRAALRCADPAEPRWPALARAVLRALLCRHRFADLIEDVAGVIVPGLSTMDDTADEPGGRLLATETVVCGMTALLFTTPEQAGRPVPAGPFERSGYAGPLRSFSEAILARRLDAAVAALLPVATELAERSGDDLLVRICQVLRLLSEVAGDDATFRQALAAWWVVQPDRAAALDADRLRGAGSVLDDATVLDLALGTDPDRLADGPAQVYRDVLAAYHDGDWDVALSRARSLLHAPGIPAVHALARAFAAEICTSRGELERADAWLAGLNPAIPGGHLIVWARCAVLWHSGRGAEAVRTGWQQYREHPGWVGADRLLLRVARYAKHLGRTEDLAAAVTELHAVHEAVRTQHSAIAAHLADGLRHSDPAALRAGLELARKHGPVGAVLGACVELAGVSDSPQSLLHEAYGLARQVSSAALRTQLSAVMRERGVPLPRSRVRRAELRTVERRIVELVSDGCTNRQIAASLAMSEKSVESHLTRLFTRTGCRSRVQLTAALLNGSLLDAAPAETAKAAR